MPNYGNDDGTGASPATGAGGNGLTLRNVLPYLGGAAGAVAGAVPQNSTTNTNTNFSNNTNTTQAGQSSSQSTLDTILNLLGKQSQAGTSTSSTVLSPEVQGFMTKLLGYSGNFQPVTTQDYITGGTQAINQSANAQGTAINDEMAARGLSTSPAAATAALNNNANRVNQISQLKANAPMAVQQANIPMLSALTQILSALPKGTATTYQQTGEQQQQQTGSQVGGQSTNTFNSGNQNSQGQQNTTSTTSAGGGVGGGVSGGFGGFLGTLAALAKIA